MRFRFLPRSRRGVLWRAVVGGILVVGFTAGAVATAALLQVKQLVTDIAQNKPLLNTGVTLPPAGSPQTLLLVGSDRRYGQGHVESNTDTMILVRLNAASSSINFMSVPRDLEVQLPAAGGGTYTAKINAAWSTGGPKLLIHTLATQVLPGLKVNHILNVDFGGFTALVNAIGCVYTMVDHRYYNNTLQTNYSSIDIQPGYQKLCGGDGGATSALAFVRFRHTDSDLVREARQQDFLRWARDQYSTSELLNQRDRLLRILGKHLSTDASLQSTDGLINLFDLAINANGHAIRDIRFPVTGQTVINGLDYLTSTPANGAAVYKEFMSVTKPPATAKKSSKPSSGSSTTRTTGSGGGASSGKKRSGKGRSHHSTPHFRVPGGMAADPGDGRSQAAQLGHMPIPVYYPDYIPSSASYCFTLTGNCNLYPNPPTAYHNSYPRRYQLVDRRGQKAHSYVMTLVINSVLGEYFTVEGTAWQDPPILSRPTQVSVINGKKLYEYYNGPHLSLVAWHTKQAVYWISNTLRDDIPPSQMIAMAATFTRAR